MDSDNSKTDASQSKEAPQSSTKDNLLGESKQIRTVSINYKHKNRKFRPWKQWRAHTAGIKYSLPPTDQKEESTYNLQNLFQMSNDVLNPTATNVPSKQSINVKIFNMPTEQEAKIEEKLHSQISSSIKVNIINIPAKQHIEMDDVQPKVVRFPNPKSNIIVINDEEREVELRTFRQLGINGSECRQKISALTLERDLENNNSKPLNIVNPQSSSFEVFNTHPLHETVTDNLKGESSSSIKVEIIKTTPKQSAIMEDVKVAPNQELKGGAFPMTLGELNTTLKENSIDTNQKSKTTLEIGLKSEYARFNESSHQNVTVNISNYPIPENTIENNLEKQDSNIIKLEITAVPNSKTSLTRDIKTNDIQNSCQEIENPSCSENDKKNLTENIMEPKDQDISSKISSLSVFAISSYSSSKSKSTSNILHSIDSQFSNPLPKQEFESHNKSKMTISNRTSTEINRFSITQNTKPFIPTSKARVMKPINDLEKEPNTANQNNCKFVENDKKSLQKLTTKISEIPTQISEDYATNPSQICSSTSKLSISKVSFSTLRQRQLELHRLRIQVEQKRLELLDLKLNREWNEMKRSKFKFEKEMKTDDCTDI